MTARGHPLRWWGWALPPGAYPAAFPFQIQAQNPHHWVWSRVRQCAP